MTREDKLKQILLLSKELDYANFSNEELRLLCEIFTVIEDLSYEICLSEVRNLKGVN